MKLTQYEKQLKEDFRGRFSETSSFRERISETLNIFYDLLVYGGRYLKYRGKVEELLEESKGNQPQNSDEIRILYTPKKFIETSRALQKEGLEGVI